MWPAGNFCLGRSRPWLGLVAMVSAWGAVRGGGPGGGVASLA